MSEYTSVYLRDKAAPLLSFREYPSGEELEGKSEEEIQSLYQEVQSYNNTVDETFGCELFYLTTTPSRRLNVLSWSPFIWNLKNNSTFFQPFGQGFRLTDETAPNCG